jgi:Fe-S-cluster-containing dehydrogenase component
MCYDRTSAGLKPMCATVCPSGALAFGTPEQMEHARPRSEPVNRFRFGAQEITTKVRVMVPRGAPAPHLDVTSAMDEPLGAAFVPVGTLLGAAPARDGEGGGTT